MVGFYSAPLQRNKAYEQYGHDLLKASRGEVLRTVAAESFYFNPGQTLRRMSDLDWAEGNWRGRNLLGVTDEDLSREMSAEEANEKYKDIGLNFEKPVREKAAEIIARRKEEELKRQSVLNRSPGGLSLGAANLAVGLAVQATDPLNIIAAFIPVVGQARYAKLVSSLGSVTRARAATGVIEGVVGTAALEPLALYQTRREQADYDMADSLLNIALGGVLGGGLHVGFGKVSDLLGRAHPKTREAMFKSSVADMAQGRPVDVHAALKTDPSFAGIDKAADPFDPRYWSETRRRQDIPEARDFSLGPLVGERNAARYYNYTPIRKGDLQYLQAVIDELKGSDSGHRIFLYNEDAPGSTVKGVKATTPDWFQRLNRAADKARSLRRSVSRKDSNVKAGDYGPEGIVTREAAEKVAEKLKAGEPLGKAEGDIALNLMDVARSKRVENVEAMAEFRAQRQAELNAEIDRIARREDDFWNGRETGTAADPEASKAADDYLSRLSDDDLAWLDEQAEELFGALEGYKAAGSFDETDLAITKHAQEVEQMADDWGKGARHAAACMRLVL